MSLVINKRLDLGTAPLKQGIQGCVLHGRMQRRVRPQGLGDLVGFIAGVEKSFDDAGRFLGLRTRFLSLLDTLRS